MKLSFGNRSVRLSIFLVCMAISLSLYQNFLSLDFTTDFDFSQVDLILDGAALDTFYGIQTPPELLFNGGDFGFTESLDIPDGFSGELELPIDFVPNQAFIYDINPEGSSSVNSFFAARLAGKNLDEITGGKISRSDKGQLQGLWAVSTLGAATNDEYSQRQVNLAKAAVAVLEKGNENLTYFGTAKTDGFTNHLNAVLARSDLNPTARLKLEIINKMSEDFVMLKYRDFESTLEGSSKVLSTNGMAIDKYPGVIFINDNLSGDKLNSTIIHESDHVVDAVLWSRFKNNPEMHRDLEVAYFDGGNISDFFAQVDQESSERDFNILRRNPHRIEYLSSGVEVSAYTLQFAVAKLFESEITPYEVAFVRTFVRTPVDEYLSPEILSEFRAEIDSYLNDPERVEAVSNIHRLVMEDHE